MDKNSKATNEAMHRSLEACARSLAGDPALALTAVPDSRGACDARALQHAYHDAQVQRQHAPRDAFAARLFNLMETERFEAMGANRFAGVRQNLDAREGVQVLGESIDPDAENPTLMRLHRALSLLCRQAFRDGSSPPAGSVAGQPASTEQALVNELVQPLLPMLKGVLSTQAEFAVMARQLSDRLATQAGGSSDGSNLLGESEPSDDILEMQAMPDDVDEDDDLGSELDESLDAEQSGRDSEEPPADTQGEAEQEEALPEDAMDEAPTAGPDPAIVRSGDTQPYRAYTTDFDEIVHAADWADQIALQDKRGELDQHIEVHGRLVRRLAARLQRVLLARQRRHWQFDLEEGQLDSARLARIVTDPLMPLSFKAESEIPFRNTTVTLLIDNSRSMLGRPIMIAASCADILARTLERCGVSVEILGFTTVHLHGGASTERWKAAGAPVNPGRLNDLRHIVYKSADMPYRSARRSLGLMLDRDILKQNIDGEALQWAYQRLMKRPEERRILMTISDGAPVDTSTLGANSGDYLAKHLQQVIDGIQRSESAELLAIGIGHDVSQYYEHAVSVYDARQLGPVMLNELEALFKQAA